MVDRTCLPSLAPPTAFFACLPLECFAACRLTVLRILGW